LRNLPSKTLEPKCFWDSKCLKATTISSSGKRRLSPDISRRAAGVHFASQPIGPKRAEGGICDVELIDIAPDRNDFSSAIGQGNAAVGARHFPELHHIVMEIQRARSLVGL
jgi:hypothetical protein